MNLEDKQTASKLLNEVRKGKAIYIRSMQVIIHPDDLKQNPYAEMLMTPVIDQALALDAEITLHDLEELIEDEVEYGYRLKEQNQ